MSNITPAQQEARTFVETLQSDAPNARTLLEQQKDKPEILDAIKEELSKLDAKQHELVTANLQNLEMQISATEQNEASARLKAQVEEMQKSMEQPIVTAEQKPDAIAATDAETKTETKPPEGFMEKMKSYAVKAKDWTKEQLDVSKWSPTKKATVATLTIGAAALLAYLAFRKSKGNENNEQKNESGGFPKWLLWVPVLGLAGWGAYKLYQKSKNVQDAVDDAKAAAEKAVEGASAVTQVGQGAVTELKETGGKAVDLIYRDAKFWVDLFSQDDITDAMEHFLETGGSLAYENGAFIMYLGTRAISLPGLSLVKVTQWLQGKENTNCWVVWGEAGAAYFMGKTAFNLFARGTLDIPLTKKGALYTAMRIGGGPIEAVTDVLKTGFTAARGAHGRQALYIRYVRQNSVAKVARKYRMWKLGGSPEGIRQGLDYWKRLSRDCDIMKIFAGEGKLFSETEFANAQIAKQTLANNIAKSINKLSPEDLAKSGLADLKIYSNLEIGEFEKWIDKFLNNTHKAGAAGAEAAAKSVDEQLRTLKELIEQIADARKTGNDARLAELLNNPIITQAAKNGDEEAKVLVRAISFLSKYLSKGKQVAGTAAKLAGPALIGLGIAFDTYLVMDNEVQLAEAKKKNNSLEIQRLEARGQSLKASGIGGVIALASGPVGILAGAAIAVSSIYTEAVYESVKEWNQTAHSWQKLDTATLLQEIERFTAEVSAANVTANPMVLNVDTSGVEKVNSETRSELYAAYLIKSSMLPKLITETDEQYADRVKLNVRTKINYLNTITDKSFGRVTTDTLRNADVYAELVMMKEELRSKNHPLLLEIPTPEGTVMIDLEKVNVATDGLELQKILDDYKTKVKPLMTTQQLAMAYAAGREMGIDYTAKGKEAMRATVLSEVRHDINRAEQILRAASFNGMADDHERNVVRLLIASDIENSVSTLTSLLENGEFGAQEYMSNITMLRAAIQGKSNEAQKAYDTAPDAMKGITYGEEVSGTLLTLAA